MANARSICSVRSVGTLPRYSAVPLPPYFNSTLSFSVPEGTPGPVYPALQALDPQRLDLAYAVTFATVAGVSVTSNTVSYKSPPLGSILRVPDGFCAVS